MLHGPSPGLVCARHRPAPAVLGLRRQADRNVPELDQGLAQRALSRGGSISCLTRRKLASYANSRARDRAHGALHRATERARFAPGQTHQGCDSHHAGTTSGGVSLQLPRERRCGRGSTVRQIPAERGRLGELNTARQPGLSRGFSRRKHAVMPGTFGISLLQSRRTSGVQASRWASVGSARLAVAMVRAKAVRQMRRAGRRMGETAV